MADYNFTTSNGEIIPVFITVRRGLRNITLRPKVDTPHRIEISRPWLSSDSAALRFVEQKRDWLEKIFARAPQKKHLVSGDFIDVLGMHVCVVYDAKIRANKFVEQSDGTYTLFVGGDEKLLENRVRMFVKEELLKQIKNLIRQTSREFWPKRICLRDTSSRWGSRSSTGTISFSWRLAFAPFDVMRYVVMHELAHTKHMDHSQAFWATVRELYGFGTERAKRWLTQNGGKLHEYL
ncbi:MAG: M48 family metallopeptidase [Alphaproteobacteria bacterium]|nr:M48 family metallopeptidase [Alphaproteobacteria bacterium]